MPNVTFPRRKGPLHFIEAALVFSLVWTFAVMVFVPMLIVLATLAFIVQIALYPFAMIGDAIRTRTDRREGS